MAEEKRLDDIKKELESMVGNYDFISKLIPKIDDFCGIYRMLQSQLKEGDKLSTDIRAEQYGSNSKSSNMFIIPVLDVDLVQIEGTKRRVLSFSCKDCYTPLKDFLLYSSNNGARGVKIL